MASSKTANYNNTFQGDSILFHGSKIPKEVKKMVTHVAKIKTETFTKLLQLVSDSLDNVNSNFLDDMKETELSDESIFEVFSGIYTILKATKRQSLTSVKLDLLKGELLSYKIPENFVNEIIKIVFAKSQTKLERMPVLKSKTSLPSLESLKWRVDVTISTSSLNRVLVPTILMEVKSSDGSVKSFEVSLSTFNELQYDVAFLLKEMDDLEKRNILKIQD